MVAPQPPGVWIYHHPGPRPRPSPSARQRAYGRLRRRCDLRRTFISTRLDDRQSLMRDWRS